MNKEQNQRILLIIIIIAIFIVVFNKRNGSTADVDRLSSFTKPVVSTMEIDKIRKMLMAEVEVSSNPKNIFADPFAKKKVIIQPVALTEDLTPKPYNPSKQIDPLSMLRVSGIVWKNGYGSAIINDEIYYIGDSVAGFTISNIKPNEVIVKDKDDLYSLSIQ